MLKGLSLSFISAVRGPALASQKDFKHFYRIKLEWSLVETGIGHIRYTLHHPEL